MTATLFDAITRHSIYLESYKSGLDGRADYVLRDLYADFALLLQKTKVTQMSELTRKALNALIRKIHQLQLRRNDAFRAKMLKELREFAENDADLFTRVVETVEGKTVDDAYSAKDGIPLLGALALRRTKDGRAHLWALIENTPDPAFGLTAKQAISQYLGYVSRNVRSLIVQAYANGWTVAETMAAIFGTRGNKFKDGFAEKARRNGATMLHTVVHHLSSVIQSGVASVFYKRYEWVSVIDSATTDICRGRDGKIYRYGKGPIPPAHPRCRSAIVPAKHGKTSQQLTYFEWISRQPQKFVDDVVGHRIGNQLRAKNLGSAGLGKYRTRNSLTLAQFLAKFPRIIQ